MIPYLILAISPLIISLFFKNMSSEDGEKRDKSQKNYLFVCGFVIFLFLALRNKSLGSTDTRNYYNMMKRAIECESFSFYYIKDGVEAGFQFFVYVLSRIFKSPQMLIVVAAAIYMISVCFCVRRNSDDVVFSLTMYITLGLMQFHMQGMRQSIAMSICLFAYEFAKRKKILPFAILVLLAMQFHRTAIVFIVVYPLCYLKFNPKSLFVFLIVAGLVFAFSGKIIQIANNLFDSDYHLSVDSGGYIATAIYFLIVVFALCCDKKIKAGEGVSVLYVTLLGLVCYLLRYFGTLAAERISFYFIFGQILLLPKTLSCFEYRSRVTIKAAIYILMFCLFAYRLAGSDFVPYAFCF